MRVSDRDIHSGYQPGTSSNIGAVTDASGSWTRELSADAHEAIRLVGGLMRRGVDGEAFRERRRVTAFTANESGLVSPSVVEERGTAVRLRDASRDSRLLLFARAGDDPEALRDTVREAARRSGGAPFFKVVKQAPRGGARGAPADDDETLAAAFASALARGVPDPRGLSLTLKMSRIQTARVVITARALHSCGESTRLHVSGVVSREGMRRVFASLTCSRGASSVGATSNECWELRSRMSRVI